LTSDRSVTAVILGSAISRYRGVDSQPGSVCAEGGNAMYLIDANTACCWGTALARRARRSRAALARDWLRRHRRRGWEQRKNALQADRRPQAIAVDSLCRKPISANRWKVLEVQFHLAGTITANQMVDTGQPIYASSALLFVGTTDVYMFFATGSDLLASSAPGGTGTFKLYGLKDNTPGAGATTKFAVNLATVSNSGGLATGERPSTSPSVAGDIVFYTTTTETASTPCADFSANLYAMTYAGGAAYDANNNGKIDNNESTIAKTFAGRASAPFIVDQHLYTGTTGANGARVEAFGDPEDFNNGIGQVGVRILSWREIR